ncbi:HemK2/MTQ2 family protein methyltransferase [Williamsia muralis]|uniref:HemK2/MTQ2 family protein methyltransferase n=2 Tax=Williamsia marianensis TaxID=85044 RepID=A0ABU4ETZ7_WILMA|nr:HemK2/MTQ2 family protein methyltransferase [Williamsia muralis]MDV7134724.1 HemK2/MTQ2 family protein methyltransferase [Williamsia muralis]
MAATAISVGGLETAKAHNMTMLPVRGVPMLANYVSDPVDEALAALEAIEVPNGVYKPQEDSRLLLAAMAGLGMVQGRRVLDLCTGSGVLAVAAARIGAAEVVAYDISPKAVQCTLDNAEAQGLVVDARLGSLEEALEAGPFDLVVSNPPYVPADRLSTATVGLTHSWHGGRDGRTLLDPLCVAAPDLLADDGTIMIVQSEFADTKSSLVELRAGGLNADVVARERIPFGPVLMQNARWLESLGMLEPGCREEELVVVRAHKAAGGR